MFGGTTIANAAIAITQNVRDDEPKGAITMGSTLPIRQRATGVPTVGLDIGKWRGALSRPRYPFAMASSQFTAERRDGEAPTVTLRAGLSPRSASDNRRYQTWVSGTTFASAGAGSYGFRSILASCSDTISDNNISPSSLGLEPPSCVVLVPPIPVTVTRPFATVQRPV